MSIYSQLNGYADYKVIDDAARVEIGNWLWVDDKDLEYEVLWYPARPPFHGAYTDIRKVSAVSVNHAAQEIHVNTPQPVVLTIMVGQAAKREEPCDECCDESACRRCNQCLRFKAPFGEVALP
jgi:hypothetical protein